MIVKTRDFKAVVMEVYNSSPLLGQVQKGDFLESINWEVNWNRLTIEEIQKFLGKAGGQNRVLEFSRSMNIMNSLR